MRPDPGRFALFEAPFYFLRHGETELNRLDLIAGFTDEPLNATGRSQALAAARALAGLGITRVHASALARARDTAAIIAGALGVPLTEIAALNERAWGELEGRPRALRAPGVTPPGGEAPEEFIARTRAGLALVEAGGVPLIVAHSGTYRVICRLLGIDPGAVRIPNAVPVRFAPPAGGAGWRVEAI